MEEKLYHIRKEIDECKKCELCKTRTNIVFGAGNSQADIVFVGEAPGEKEDEIGLPFIGAAGNLLDDLIDSIGLTREEVYILNVVKCRPPENRDPKPEEIKQCFPIAVRQIKSINPKVIVTLGNYATKQIVPEAEGITKVRGQKFLTKGGFTVIPMLHPASALYNPNNRPLLFEDFKLLEEYKNE